MQYTHSLMLSFYPEPDSVNATPPNVAMNPRLLMPIVIDRPDSGYARCNVGDNITALSAGL